MLSINPATGTPVASYTLTPVNDAERAATRAAAEAHAWQLLGFSGRAETVRSVAHFLRQRAPRYAELMAREMGKPVFEGLAEVEKCAWCCEYFAQNARGFLETQLIESDASSSYVVFEPLGVLFSIMPWNFPFWQFFRFAAPALMAVASLPLRSAPGFR